MKNFHLMVKNSFGSFEKVKNANLVPEIFNNQTKFCVWIPKTEKA